MRGSDKRVNLFEPVCLVVSLLTSLSTLPDAHAAGKRVTFEEYQKLDDATRRRMIRRYVKRSPRGQWEILQGSYHIRTDISDEAALALAVKMDEFYAGFTSIFKGSFRIRARPDLYALKDSASFRSAIDEWAGEHVPTHADLTGFFVYRGRKYALFGCAEWGDERLYRILFHEGTHHLLHFYIGRQFPRWFDEGVATNFQDWDVSLSAERNIYESIWKSWYPLLLQAMVTGRKIKEKELSKPDLIRLMSSTDEEWLDPEGDPAPLYAQAWGFVNFLLSSGKDGQKNVNTLITSFRKGVVFHKVAPIPIRVALAGQFLEYVEGVIVPHVEYSLPVKELLKAGNSEDAALTVEEGLREYPKNFELLYYRGLLALEAGRAAEAYRTLRVLKKKKPRHPLLYRTLGRAALAAGEKPKARTWLKHALKENCRDEEVRGLLK